MDFWNNGQMDVKWHWLIFRYIFTRFRQNEQSTIALVVYLREDIIFSANKLSLKCALYNCPHNWNNRTVEELEEDAVCSWSVCK